MNSWGYSGATGPAYWGRWYPLARSGTHQSPVDIVPGSSVPHMFLTELFHSYTPAQIRLENTGATWRLGLPPGGSVLSGGPLTQEYKVVEMLAHWGDKAGRGSEHTISGKSFDAEIHIVHYNSKYGDPTAAMTKPDGLAVLAILVKTGKTHPELRKVCDQLQYVRYRGDMVHSQQVLDLARIIPGNTATLVRDIPDCFQETRHTSPTLAPSLLPHYLRLLPGLSSELL